MNSVVLFDPSIRSLNKGDEIIMNSAKRELKKAGILKGRYVMHSATHAPVVTAYQNTRRNPRMRFYDEAEYKFICGSNLLWKDMMKPRPVLNVNLWNCMPYRNSILMGVGIGQAESRTNLYTKALYSRILSREYVHSTRDSAALEFLSKLGYQAIDTGCPAMWGLTPEFCAGIPHDKADNVVFTLTDYCRETEHDQRLIDILKKNYDKVYFWVQGAFDHDYFKSFRNTDGISVIAPDLEAFSEILNRKNIEYVGTRLHAGLFAMQHRKRAVMLAVDNRLRDMSEAYALPALERTAIEELPELINSSFATDIRLKQKNIEKWLGQFCTK